MLQKFFNKKEQKLDPYKVGAIAGPDAFSAGDCVVLVNKGNKPAKVRCRNSDFAQTIRVILGDETNIIYGEANYFADDLGYPLNSDLWSQHQKEWYQKCHTEQWLKQRWQRNSSQDIDNPRWVPIVSFIFWLLLLMTSIKYLQTHETSFNQLAIKELEKILSN